MNTEMTSTSSSLNQNHGMTLDQLEQQIDLLASGSVYNKTTIKVNQKMAKLESEKFALITMPPLVESATGDLAETKSSSAKLVSSSLHQQQYAAVASNLTFAYGRGKNAFNALNDITIRVPVGSIYGILGPSGCGKSTLVHCLVGSLKPKRGLVKVFGEVPGSHRALVPGPGVGYMPQEIGLFNEFTIQETLFFFGRLYRLPIDAINDRITFLLSFLELPDKGSMVGKLSDGQARRVSLAAALVHKPPLLVLDEPTVGIDPVLRQSIWSHLRSLTDSHGITVIITTHYIEEARQANIVAFMRHGALLEEGNPESLIRRFRLNNLEEVFLTLCAKNKANRSGVINGLDCAHKSAATVDEEHNEQKKPLLDSSNPAIDACSNLKCNDEEFLSVSIEPSTSGNATVFTTTTTTKKQQNDDSDNERVPSLSSSKNDDEHVDGDDGSGKKVDSVADGEQHSVNEKSAALSNQSNTVALSSSSSSDGMPTNNVTQPTSPIFNNTLQHQKIQDAQQLAHRLLMKRNKVLDHFSRSSALITKNFIRMWRNLPVLIFTSFIPAIQCCLFFLCLGRPPYDIPVSVYNDELPLQYSVDFLREIDNHTINLHMFHTYDAGVQSVKSGDSKALLTIGRNFSKALMEKSLDFTAVDDETLRMSQIDLYLDMSQQFHANSIREKVYAAYENFIRTMLIDTKMNPNLADSPIHIAEPIFGKKNPTVTEFMAPGFILSLAFFASIATAALTLVLERKDGLLERSLVSGVNPNEYILSHVVTQTVVVILQTFSVLLIAFFIFEIPNTGSVFWISVLIVMQGVCGMSYGVLISAIAREESFTLAACMGSMFPQFLLSGVVWPVDTMPKPLVLIATFFSQAKSLDAVRSMLYRGWDPLHHFDVSMGFIISASWTIVFLFIATILFNVHK